VVTTRSFHIGDILSITTGRLVAPGHMSAVHEILDWMTGDALFTHQLPRASDECAPALRSQHPDLGAVEAPEFADPAHVDRWLGEQVDRFGEHRDVAPLAGGEHAVIDPIAELATMMPDKTVIPVVLPDPGGDR
jgi:hypothetical protein